jgi:hypothetical protein
MAIPVSANHIDNWRSYLENHAAIGVWINGSQPSQGGTKITGNRHYFAVKQRDAMAPTELLAVSR